MPTDATATGAPATAANDPPGTAGHDDAAAARPPEHERETTVDGRSIAVAEYGDPGGRPVVLLHGTPGSRRLGDLFAPAAEHEDVRLLAVDRPGCGRSEPWPDRTLADTGRFVAAALDEADVSSARLVGFSGGGPHALAAAATHGDRVRRVDLVAGAVPPSLDEPPAPRRALAAMAARTPRVLGGLLRARAWLAARRPGAVVAQYTDAPDDVADPVAAAVARDFREALATHRSGTVHDLRLLADEWPFPLDAVTCPVGLRHGERDTNVPVAGARGLAERLPEGELTTLPEADHLGTLLAYRSRGFGAD